MKKGGSKTTVAMVDKLVSYLERNGPQSRASLLAWSGWTPRTLNVMGRLAEDAGRIRLASDGTMEVTP